MIVDGFLRSFDSLRAYADTAKFIDEINQVDGVVYPKICREIPTAIKEEILQRLAIIKGAPLDSYTLFMRQSPEGVVCPHQAHTDNAMGRWSLMLYLNRPEHCIGGTGLLRHKASGIAFAPADDEFLDIIHRDQNTAEAWDVYEVFEMVTNRAAIFDASKIHRAEPVGGYGDSNHNARLVLTCFFT